MRPNYLRSFFLSMGVLLSVSISTVPAYGELNAWAQKYYACFSKMPGIANDDPIIGLHASHIRHDWVPFGHYDKTIPGRSKQMLALADLLQKGRVIWTGSDPENMVMNFLMPDGVIAIPHAKARYKEERNSFRGPVTNYHYDVKVVDPNNQYPPFYPESIVMQFTGEKEKGVSAYTSFFFSEKGRGETDKNYTEVKLERRGDEKTRVALREKLLAGIASLNERYRHNMNAIGFANGFVRDQKNRVDVNRDYTTYLQGYRECLGQFPLGEPEERGLREALVRAIQSFESTFSSANQKGSAPAHGKN